MDSAENIIHFVTTGNLAIVAKKLKAGLPVDVQNDDGVTPLQAAAAYGHNDLVKFLLSKSANIELPNNYGWSPLLLAAKHGHSSTVSVLLNNRARINTCNKFGLSPLAAAAWSGQMICVKLLLDAGALDQVCNGQFHQAEDLMPVMIAAFLGHVAILQMLLGRGAPVNHVSTVTGWTPLMLAACNGHKQAAQMLIEYGADVTAIDCCGKTARDIAQMMSHHDVEVLLQTVTSSRTVTGKESELLAAVRQRNSSLISSILKEDTTCANSFDVLEGLSALMIASSLGAIDIVRSLVESGANVNTQSSNDGWTALMYAAFHKHFSVASYLLKNGADACAESHHGYTVLDLINHSDCTRNDCSREDCAKSDFTKESCTREECTKENCNGEDCIRDDVIRTLNIAIHPWRPDVVCATATLPFLSMNNSSSDSKSSRFSFSQQWLDDMLSSLSSPKSSSKRSSEVLDMLDAYLNETDLNDEVFDNGQLTKSGEKYALNMTDLKKPERALANDLKKHFPVTTCFLTKPCNRVRMKDSSPRKKTSSKVSPKIRSLRVPHLLKDYVPKYKISNKREGASNKHKSTAKAIGISLSDAFNDVISLKKLFASTEELTVSPGIEDADKSYSFIDKLGMNELGSISQIIKDESLQKHVQKMKDEEIDIGAFKYLTEEDLNGLDIQTVTSRKLLLELAEKLKNKSDTN